MKSHFDKRVIHVSMEVSIFRHVNIRMHDAC